MGLSKTAKNQNQSIEQKAVEAAKAYEKQRTGKELEQITKRVGYDLDSGDRKIEVKGTIVKWEKFRSSFQVVTDNERRNATYIYQYCDVLGKPDLHIFKMSKVHKALQPELSYRLEYSQCRDDESDETKK